MNKVDPEKYVEAGLALVQLGRWMQRTDPVVNKEGSQFDEDVVLAGLLPDPQIQPRGHDKGIYVDIGAHHAKECSNTWQFYKRGWRGLLIEPLPDCWPNLLLERPEDYLCPIAASNESGMASLRLCQSVSSLRPDWQTDASQVISVRTMPIREILKLYPLVDWSQTRLCSIDVEGYERQVLEGFDWTTFRPEVIVLEYRDYCATDFGKDISGEWKSILVGQGYSLVKLPNYNPLNQIWKRK